MKERKSKNTQKLCKNGCHCARVCFFFFLNSVACRCSLENNETRIFSTILKVVCHFEHCYFAIIKLGINLISHWLEFIKFNSFHR